MLPKQPEFLSDWEKKKKKKKKKKNFFVEANARNMYAKYQLHKANRF